VQAQAARYEQVWRDDGLNSLIHRVSGSGLVRGIEESVGVDEVKGMAGEDAGHVPTGLDDRWRHTIADGDAGQVLAMPAGTGILTHSTFRTGRSWVRRHELPETQDRADVRQTYLSSARHIRSADGIVVASIEYPLRDSVFCLKTVLADPEQHSAAPWICAWHRIWGGFSFIQTRSAR